MIEFRSLIRLLLIFQAIELSRQCLTITNPYSKCGQSSAQSKSTSQEPWIVSITCDYKVSDDVVDKIGHICGGTVISHKHVLTAAHCLQIPSNYIDKKYYLNNYNPNIESVFKVAFEKPGEEEYTYYKIKKVHIHELFDNVTLVNDIALLELEDELEFSKRIQPICLPDQEIQGYPNTGKDSYLVAWHNRDKSIGDIKQVDMSVVNDDYCSKYANQETQICAKALRSTGACRGDSGGPLVVQDRACGSDGYQCSVLAGITSYILGKKSNPYDCNSLYPTFFTRVSAYTPWIKTNMFSAY